MTHQVDAEAIATAELEAIFLPRVGGVELAELLTSGAPLKSKCSGCAYRAGTDAYSNPITAQKRDDCDRTGHPFWCHMHKDRLDLPVHLCAGWCENNAAVRDVLMKEKG